MPPAGVMVARRHSQRTTLFSISSNVASMSSKTSFSIPVARLFMAPEGSRSTLGADVAAGVGVGAGAGVIVG